MYMYQIHVCSLVFSLTNNENMPSPAPILIISVILLSGLFLISFTDFLIECAQCQFGNEVNVKETNIS